MGTFENGCVARLDGQTGNVGNDFRASLKDDEKNANGAGYSLEDEIVVQLGPHLNLSNCTESVS